MAKFKVGDKVIANEKANNRYGITKQGWIGIVKEVNEFDNIFRAIGEKDPESDYGYCGLSFDCFDLLVEDDIKVGDWVEYNRPYISGTGVVRAIKDDIIGIDCFKIKPDEGHIFYLEFDKTFEKVLPDKTGSWFKKNCVTKIDKEPELNDVHIGDRIQIVTKFLNVQKGATGTIIGFSANGYYCIRFDSKCFSTGHNCNKILPDDSKQGYFLPKDYFKIIDRIMGEHIPQTQKPIIEKVTKVKTSKYTSVEEKAIRRLRKFFKI